MGTLAVAFCDNKLIPQENLPYLRTKDGQKKVGAGLQGRYTVPESYDLKK